MRFRHERRRGGAVRSGRMKTSAIPLYLLLAIGLASCDRQQSAVPDAVASIPDFQRAASLQELMVLHVDPAVDPLWESVGTIETREGIETRTPKNEEQWQEQRANALRLIEIGNLLLIPGRRAVPESGSVPGAHIAGVLDHAEIEAAVKREWPKFAGYAGDFQTAAIAALHATEAHDAKALLEAGERLQEACEQCHGHFWYPGDKPPADPEPGVVKPLEHHAP